MASVSVSVRVMSTRMPAAMMALMVSLSLASTIVVAVPVPMVALYPRSCDVGSKVMDGESWRVSAH